MAMEINFRALNPEPRFAQGLSTDQVTFIINLSSMQQINDILQNITTTIWKGTCKLLGIQ